MVLGHVIDKIVDKIADKVIDKIVDSALSHIMEKEADTFDILNSRMDELHEKTEQVLASHLRAGFTYLRLGLFDWALHKFVEAEAIEPYSPVSKFWLAISIWKIGNRQIGADKYRESLYLNPFVAEGYGVGTITIELENTLRPELRSDAIQRKLNDRPFTRSLPSHLRPWAYAPHTAIRRCSFSGHSPILNWEIGRVVRATGTEKELAEKLLKSQMHRKHVLTSLTPDTGDMDWQISLKDEQLCYSTLTVVVLYDSKRRVYILRDPTDGKLIKTMSTIYYETVFLPPSIAATSKELPATNISMLDIIPAFGKCIEKHQRGSVPYGLWMDSEHLDYAWMSLPYTQTSVEMRVSNNWDLIWFGGLTTRSPTCDLGSMAKIAFVRR